MCVYVFSCVHVHMWVSACSSVHAHLLAHATVHLHIADNGLQLPSPVLVLRTELTSSSLVGNKLLTYSAVLLAHRSSYCETKMYIVSTT